MKKPNKVAIDGDLVAYKAAAAAQKNFIIVTHKKSNQRKIFDSRTEFYGHFAKKAGGWLAKRNEERAEKNLEPYAVEDFDIEDDYELEPEANALQIAKTMINNMLKANEVEEYLVLLTGKKNFRDEVATMVEYKGNRKDLEKPVYLYLVKDYLIEVHGAKIVEDYEADDELAILAATGEYIQATIDKDAYQVIGWIYDFEKADKPFEVKRGAGRLWKDKKGKYRGMGFKQLCFQMLYGDSVDNIKPRFLCRVKFGEKGSYELLHPLRTPKACLQAVVDKYREWYPEPVTYTHWNGEQELTKDWFEIASEVFTLLYMLKSPEDNTDFEKICKALEVDYDRDR